MSEGSEDSLKKAKDFAELSRERHSVHYADYTLGGRNAALSQAWLRHDTADAWRQNRMYAAADPLLDAFPSAHWLTVGDGRFGKDAHYLIERGAAAHATDISDMLLKEAAASGYIQGFSKEDAEALSFADGAFDFVLCKESLHHFPRPMRALYEMLRVARRAVLLIEPNDLWIPFGAREMLFRSVKLAIHRLLGRRADGHNFEEVGNYVYTLSRREIEKVALSLGLPTVAFRGINDYYQEGLEFEPTTETSPLFRSVQRKIDWYDFLYRIGVNQPGLLASVIFKEPVSDALQESFRRAQYQVVQLPGNPFASP